MGNKVNLFCHRSGTFDGEIKFGHISETNELYAVYLNNYNPINSDSDHYIAMIKTGQDEWQKNSTMCRSTGSFQVVAGDAALDGTPAVNIEANSGDIILNAHQGRIKLIAKDIELIAGGESGERGNIRLKANEKITLDAGQMIDIHSKVSCKIVSDKDVEVIGRAIVDIISNDVNLVEGADVAAAALGKARKGGDRVATREAARGSFA
tara:strand:- start:333 stop:956 length:624 start_codon:yes stop_codon:yes gene_type:complete